MREETICQSLPPRLRMLLADKGISLSDYEELQIRQNQPVVFVKENQKYMLDAQGILTRQTELPFLLTQEEMTTILQYACRYSVYAAEPQLKEGYLTLQGGHRLGICGEVLLEGDQITGIRHVQAYHFRIAHEKKGCAKQVFPYLWEDGRFLSTLILAYPGKGKTTLLRDLIRMLSDGMPGYPALSVSIADERGEIAGCVNGIPQNDIGRHSDVMDKGSKQKTMTMLLRSMAPQVIAADELGSEEDNRIMREAKTWGVGLLTTVHGSLEHNPVGQRSLEGLFDRYIEIQVEKERKYRIYDSNYQLLHIAGSG